jgi:hypothetical protein
LILIPGSPASWYRVDLRTGTTLGYVEGGGGQDFAEYAMLLAEKVEEALEWKSRAELLNSVLECAMNAIDAGDSAASFANCLAIVGIGEAFGWASGGILGGAGRAIGGPLGRWGGIIGGEILGGAYGDAVDAARSGGR